MSSNMFTVRRCGNTPALCLLDVQWAAELAFNDVLLELGWSVSKMAKQLNVSLNTIRRWCNGDTTVDPLVIETCPEVAVLFWGRLQVRQDHIRTKRRAA